MKDSERYRHHADEAERMARAIPFSHEREAMLKIARQWRQLETDALKREGGPIGKPT
jgi:hypothetical protein